MSIHKEKLSFLCFLSSSISDRFNFFAVSSLHKCTQPSPIPIIFPLHHRILYIKYTHQPLKLVRCWIILGWAWASSKLHLECPHRHAAIRPARLLWLQGHGLSFTVKPWASRGIHATYAWVVMLGTYLKPAYTLLFVSIDIQSSWNIWMRWFKFTVSGRSKQLHKIHTRMRNAVTQCSHAFSTCSHVIKNDLYGLWSSLTKCEHVTCTLLLHVHFFPLVYPGVYEHRKVVQIMNSWCAQWVIVYTSSNLTSHR